MNNLIFEEKKSMDFVAIGRAAVDLNPNEICLWKNPKHLLNI